jgi:tripartite-type tricarboxylate transporter receptor subunit TctC
VPAGTPPEIVARLNREVLQVITQPDMRTRMAAEGSEVVRTSPQDFGRFVQDEAKKYADIAKAANLQRQ